MQGKAASILSSFALVLFAVFVFAATLSATTREKLLHRFTPQGTDAAFPIAPLIADGHGNFYGTSYLGGTYNAGVVFELSPHQGGGLTETILYNFHARGGDGNSPQGNLVLDSLGNLYGTTSGGGRYGAGTVFALQPQSNGTWTENVVYSFDPYKGNDGSSPRAGLTFDTSGNLYGTTEGGGTNGGGTVFELSPRQGGGWIETVLYSFNPNGGDAGYPVAGLAFDSSGNLYGVSNGGGANYQGAVFQLSPVNGGWNEQVLYSFCSENNCADGSTPYYGAVIADKSGTLYGTTQSGGAYQGGVVFQLSQGQSGWTETVVHSFGHSSDGIDPAYATLLMDSNGTLYGTTSIGGSDHRGTAYQLSPRHGGGWAYKVLHSFKLTGSDGWFPFAGLILDHSGDLLGTTAGGGSNSDGTVFHLAPGQGGWTENILHSFNWNQTEGANPEWASLISDRAGNLYGTTYPGGAYDSGTAFELKPNGRGGWTETILYSFGDRTNAGDSDTALIFDSHGNLYGASATGGTYGDWGTVFELLPRQDGRWTQRVLHSFNSNGIDGYYPFGSLVFDSSGNLYGTTSTGGQDGLGIVFQLKPNKHGAWTETILHNFAADGTDGIEPYSDLTIDSAGNLYGMTESGGSAGGGTIFEVSPDGHGGWIEQVLYSFGSQNNDGFYPFGGNLISDNAHNLYGMTQYGGMYGGGTVFQLTPHQDGSWTEQVIYSFCARKNCMDGAYPQDTLVFDAQGNLYGTTSYGGRYYSEKSSGTVFKLTPTQGGTWIEHLLHSFHPNDGDGSYPEGGLVFDATGRHLFGTTDYGGGAYNAGTVFELTP